MYKYFLLLFLFTPVVAMAAANPGVKISGDVARAEAYLQNLDTARGRFTQTDNIGREVTGTFYLDRPGRLRFEYDAPLNDFVVADGILIYFYDAELEQQTHAPIGQTLADFLLQDDITFSEGVTLLETSDKGELFQMVLAQSDDIDAGTLRLGFTKEPFQLKRWRVTDAQGAVTEIELENLETGLDLPRDLFVYSDPNAHQGNDFNE